MDLRRVPSMAGREGRDEEDSESEPGYVDQQLLQLAKQLGKEWKQVGIYLGLDTEDLDKIQAVEEDVIMQKLQMLVEWKRRQPLG